MMRLNRACLVVVVLLAAGAAFAQANLVPNLPAGWSWPVVPRPTNDATSTNVPLPLTLTGDATATYLNSAWRNVGTVSTVAFHNKTVLDGATVIVDRSCAALAAGASALGYNGGPFYFPAGRHTLELRVDADGVVTESSEADNNVARQWVWAPATIPPGMRALRPAPPVTTGGWSVIPAGQDKFDNCDGVRFTTADGLWSALYQWSPDVDTDNGLRYYEPTTGASNGFAVEIGSSGRAGRGVEAIVANGRNVGVHTYDVGVIRVAGAGDYQAVHTTSGSVAWGDSITDTFAQDEMLKIYEVSLPAAGIGPVSTWLQMSTTDPSVVVAWVDRTFTSGGLTSISPTAATDDQGRVRLDVTATAAGYHAVILLRDPDWGTGPRSFGLKIAATLPDLVPYAPAGWHAPIVPRLYGDPTPDVTLPDSLPGYEVLENYTSYSVTLRNDSPAAVPAEISVPATVYVDDRWAAGWVLQGMAPLSDYSIHGAAGDAVYPGRHTLSMRVNGNHSVLESRTDNNTYAEQYCWGPASTVSLGARIPGYVPPLMTAGWGDAADGGVGFWYDCDGLRMPTAPSDVWWQALIIAPEPGDDYDLTLHESLRGAKDGFGPYLSKSEWLSGQTDYVLVNRNMTAARPFDVGIYRYLGASRFNYQYTTSTTHGSARTEALAPYHGTDYDLMQIHEWYFTPGIWTFYLRNLSTGGKYGITFHSASAPYGGKQTNNTSCPPAGGDCRLDVAVSQSGWYGLTIWAQDAVTRGNMHYQLTLWPGGSPVPDTPQAPKVTALRGAAPNPFNPRTTVSFELATAGRVTLAIYDVRGVLVRRLVDTELAAGQQQAAWDGRDEAGQDVASGTYFARLVAGDISRSTKLVLIR